MNLTFLLRYTSAICLLIFGSIAYGQTSLILKSDNAEIDPAIQPKVRDEIILGATQIINSYASYATFVPGSGSDFSTLLGDFVSLFEATAILPRDFVAEPSGTTMELNSYILEINERFSDAGLPGKITSPRLEKMSVDAFDKSLVLSEISLTRRYDNYLANDNSIRNYNAPVTRDLRITLSTSIYFTSASKIRVIQLIHPKGSVLVDKPIVKTEPTAPVTSNPPSATTKLATTFTDWHSIDANDQDKVTGLIEGELDKYAEYGTLLMPGKQSVSLQATDRFKGLFASQNSFHIADMEQFQENNMTVEAYCERAADLMKEGIRFDLSETALESVEKDASGYYIARVLAIKRMDRYIDFKSGMAVPYITPKKIKIRLTYEINKNMENAELLSVLPFEQQQAREDASTFLAFQAGYGTMSLNATPINSWADVTDHVTFFKPSKLSFGVDLRTNFFAPEKALNKPLFFSAGIYYSKFTITTIATGISYSPPDSLTTDGFLGTYQYEVNDLKDDITFDFIEVPIGLDYRLFKLDKIRGAIFLGARLIPGYSIQVKHMYKAKPFSNLSYEELGFTFYNGHNFNLNQNQTLQNEINNAYGIGENNLVNKEGNPIDNKLTFGYEFQGQFQMVLSGNLILFAGAKYQGFPSSFIDHNRDEPHYPFQSGFNDEDGRNSVADDFYNKISSSTILGFAGIALKFR